MWVFLVHTCSVDARFDFCVNISNHCTMIKEVLLQSFVFHHHFNEHSHHNWPPVQEFYTVQTLKALRYFVVTVAMTMSGQARFESTICFCGGGNLWIYFHPDCASAARSTGGLNGTIIMWFCTSNRLWSAWPGSVRAHSLLWSYKWWLYSLAFDPVILLLQYLLSTLVNLVDFKCAL